MVADESIGWLSLLIEQYWVSYLSLAFK